jgi:hypothetical protein
MDHCFVSCTLPVCEDILIFNLYLSFVEELYLPPPVNSPARPMNPRVPVTPLLMHKHFGVPMLFFLDRQPYISERTIGNVSFIRRNKEGMEVSLGRF